MMTFLNNIKIRYKLILLLAFPMTALLSFSGKTVFDKIEEAEKMTSLQKLSKLAVRVSALVHELQKERGASALYMGSRGQKFSAELRFQRAGADQRLADLQGFLQDFALDRFGGELSLPLNRATGELQRLSQVRSSADALRAGTAEVIDYYTKINASFLQTIAVMPKISDPAELLLQISAYVNFLEGKERAGVERAVLSNVFAQDGFGSGMFDQFIRLVAEQNTYIRVFERFATQPQQRLYLEKMSHPSVTETERLRQVAVEQANVGQFGVDATHWFRKQTEKINLLKEVEDQLSQDLTARANALYGKAMSTLYFFLAVSILAVLVVGASAFFIIRGIVRPLSEAVACTETLGHEDITRLGVAIEAMSQGDLTASVETEAQHLDLESKDEVGAMVRSLNGILTQTHSTIAAFQQTQGTLKEMLDETHKLVEGAKRGRLDTRANVTGFQGSYAELVEGINVTLDTVLTPLDEAARVLEQVAGGNLAVRVEGDYQGEYTRIKETLNTAVEALWNSENRSQSRQQELQEAIAERERQDAIKTSQMELSEKMRGDQDLVELGGNIITYLAHRLDAQIGGFYLAEEDVLKLTASYAFTTRKNLSNQFAWGEGVVGQAALEGETILLTQVPDDYIKVRSGLGETPPRNILVLPFLHDGQVKGVIELGSLCDLTQEDLEFLHQTRENIAIAITTAQSRARVDELLIRTQSQAEELQTREEELRTNNQQLEEQTRELKESEGQLQAQQEELRVVNEELEEKAEALEENASEMLHKNEALDQAREEIEEKAKNLELTSKYKSEFLANMSHELRTPLNSLLILSQLLAANKDENLTDKQVEFARTIYDAGADLLQLINEVLDLSKVEAGRMDVEIEPFSLKDFMADIEQKFAPMAATQGLRFDLELDEELPPTLQTDSQKLGQIVRNLLSNAVKFTAEGGVALRIGRPAPDAKLSHLEFPSWQGVAFTVSDTGIGIPADKQKLIFEAFQQADGTTSREYGGTGLGLSISRELAKLLGGEIQLQSEAGKGSTFTLYLPEVLPATEPDEADQPAPEPAAGDGVGVASATSSSVEEGQGDRPGLPEGIEDDRSKTHPGDRSLLVIEDDPKFARILLDYARERGFKCLVAGEGETGLHFADYYKPSAIILDVDLPGLDGWMVMERLKDHLATRHIPVHFISVSDGAFDAMKRGAIGFLTKPVSMGQIDQAFGRIETMIDKRVKNLLVVEDDERQRQSLIELLDAADVEITAAPSAEKAYELLATGAFDCVVLDLKLPEMSGLELLEKIRSNDSISHLPIVVYTGKELSREEQLNLDRYAESIIVKGAKSPERLLDETALFLHRVEAQLPEDKRQMIQLLHDKEAIFRERTVLLVDDDMRNIFALSHILQEKGLKVLTGKDGREGLVQLEQDPDIDLVLMDIMMPEMDGYEAMQEIRKQSRFRSLPIVALTAKAMQGDRAKCIEAGASDYLSKPVDTDQLLSMLRVWLYQ